MDPFIRQLLNINPCALSPTSSDKSHAPDPRRATICIIVLKEHQVPFIVLLFTIKIELARLYE